MSSPPPPPPRDKDATVRCVHHGAAASVSGNQAVTYFLSDDSGGTTPATLAFASHALVHLCATKDLVLPGNADVRQRRKQTVRPVQRVLRPSFLEEAAAGSLEQHVHITAMAASCGGGSFSDGSTQQQKPQTLVTAFSNGRIHVWLKQQELDEDDDAWQEHAVVVPGEDDDNVGGDLKKNAAADHRHRSVTCIDASWSSTRSSTSGDSGEEEEVLRIAAGSSAGATLYHCRFRRRNDETKVLLRLDETHALVHGAVSSIRFWRHLLLVGTAAPRHNKIHVYYYGSSNDHSDDSNHRHCYYAGSLTGHENWITSLAMSSSSGNNNNHILASASQDARIRLWKFQSRVAAGVSATPAKDSAVVAEETAENSDDNDDDDVLLHGDLEQDEEGESRLEIVDDPENTVLSVTLEALLYGHEESVTAVAWHPCPTTYYGVEHVLISSSLDRMILLWAESSPSQGQTTIWTPISRVGSAGGILGGPIGSSLLGFNSVIVEPVEGRTLVGHAYGGTLHVWNLEQEQATDDDEPKTEDYSTAGRMTMTVEERAARVRWTASPCVTGHFGAVADLAWEASAGAYLLTVSHDQTCRLWAEVDRVCVELARPQVHGYSLSAVVSVSTAHYPHRLVTGADEKEVRAFDAPKTTLRILKAACGIAESDTDAVDRVERAFIPSLGLSNKASAADAAEEDGDNTNAGGQQSESIDCMTLPLERDLGAVSIWPEVRKLFGHNTEIFCLASTLAARTAGNAYTPTGRVWDDVVVASSCKARDVDDAAIRIWDIEEGKCLQTLSGGHKSTVASMSFSPDGWYLASAGKDRRLCVWKRDDTTNERPSFSLAWAKDSAHKRIIWSVHFCPFDATLLASGSREGCVKIWRLWEDDSSSTEGKLELTEYFSFAPSFKRKEKPDAVTALSFAPLPLDPQHAILSLGLESGRIELWKIPLVTTPDGAAVPRMMSTNLTPSLCHAATITKLAWRPLANSSLDEDATTSATTTLQLASSSTDFGCRIFELSIPR